MTEYGAKKDEKNTKLRIALILESIALLWSIPSCNLFGIITVIAGWTAYSGNKRRFAKLEGVFAVLSSAASVAEGILLRSIVLKAGIDSISGFFDTVMVISIAAMAVYAVSAAFSFRGAAEMTDEQDTGGLLD